MSFDNTLLRLELEDVRQNGDSSATCHVGVKFLVNGKWISPLKVDYMDNERDYINARGDLVLLQVIFTMPVYTFDIVPNRDNILVDVTKTPLLPASNDENTAVARSTVRYRAVLVDQSNLAITADTAVSSSREALEVATPKTVMFQLVNESLFINRMRTVGRIYRNSSPMDALQTILSEVIASEKGNDSQRIKGINTISGYNTVKRTQILIPPNTRLLEVGKWLQENDGGIYATGFGCYLQQQYWWIYPLFDVGNINQRKKTLTVFNVPADRYGGAEKTYRVRDNRVTVIAAGDTRVKDESTFKGLNEGTGARFADAGKLLGGFVKTKDGRMLIDRATNMFEFAVNHVADTLSNVSWSKPSTNAMVQYSQLAERAGQYVDAVWQFGDADQLEPGMPVIFHSIYDESIESYQGVLVGVHEVRTAGSPGAVTASYPASVRLRIFISRKL